MRGRFRIKSIRFPIHMLVVRPQKTSGNLEMRFGPGVTPWIINAPKRTAAVAEVGIPRVIKGMNAA